MNKTSNTTKKITYSAVGAAVSAVCVFLTNIVPLKVSLLMFAALVYYIVFCKCGLMYGLLDIAASLLLTFFIGGMTPLSSAFLLTATVFAPYSLLCFFIKKFYYTKWQTALLRLGIMAVFSVLALTAVWGLAQWITSIDIFAIAGKLGGFVVLGLIFAVLTVIFDFLFNQLSIRLIKLIK